MGGQETKPEPPPAPPKTIQEMVKDFKQTIRKLKNEFQRESNKLEMNSKKMQRDIETMIKQKEPKTTIRITAQAYLQNQTYIKKYHQLQAQLDGVEFQMNTIATNEALCQVMSEMGQMMKMGNEAVDIKNVQKSIEVFQMQVEKQNIISETMNDMMADDMEDTGDEECDKLIMQFEQKASGSGGEKINDGVLSENNSEIMRDIAPPN